MIVLTIEINRSKINPNIADLMGNIQHWLKKRLKKKVYDRLFEVRWNGFPAFV
jgi:hypothetical protein